MAYKCDLCGKGKLILRQQRHHKGVAGGKWLHRAPRTIKISRPNLHVFGGVLGGVSGKWKLCTKCLRLVKASQSQPEKAVSPSPAVSQS